MKQAIYLGVVAAAAALPSMGQTGGTITSCVNNLTGASRIVSKSTDCLLLEHVVVWNQQGPAGVQGPAGPMGVPGATGPAGATGAAGPAGAKGATGATGNTGASGPAGAMGLTGAAGTAGPMGATGLTGATGAAGPVGPAGATGPTGANGQDGKAGPMGPAGANGVDGKPGLTGPAGPAGATGAAEPAGPTGPIGPAGGTGADGGNVLLANDTFPATINGGVPANGPAALAFSLVGTNPSGHYQDTSVLLPNDCHTQTISAIALDAPGTSTATLYLNIGFPSSDGVPVFTHFQLCSITANSGREASCTGTQGVNLAGFGANLIGLYVEADAGFQGAHMATKFTCTP